MEVSDQRLVHAGHDEGVNADGDAAPERRQDPRRRAIGERVSTEIVRAYAVDQSLDGCERCEGGSR